MRKSNLMRMLNRLEELDPDESVDASNEWYQLISSIPYYWDTFNAIHEHQGFVEEDQLYQALAWLN